jgi:hypothetical protein
MAGRILSKSEKKRKKRPSPGSWGKETRHLSYREVLSLSLSFSSSRILLRTRQSPRGGRGGEEEEEDREEEEERGL